MMETLWQDVKYGVRMLVKSRGVTLVAVLTLALGIGANTAMFSVAHAVLLRPLPFDQPDRLVWLWGEFEGGSRASVSPPDFADYRRNNRSFAQLAAMGTLAMNVNFTGQDEPELLPGRLVTAGFFETLGVRPLLGRTIQPADEQVRLPQTAVLSHGLWQRRFQGNAQIIGQAITLDGLSMVVAGVMPKEFNFPEGTQVWVAAPYHAEAFQMRRGRFLRPIGRLRNGVTLEQAQQEFDSIAQGLEQRYPDTNRSWRLGLVPLTEQIVGEVRPALLLLLAAVGGVLLIACANVANLLLTRATARSKEMAIRLALGAGARRLAAQLFTESALLSLTGGAVGALIAAWGIDVLRTLLPSGLPRTSEISVDATALAFTALVCLLTAALFGLAPALAAARTSLQDTLKEGGRTSAAGARQPLRNVLVVSEVALSLVLLIGSGLLIRSFARLVSMDPGFNPRGLLVTRLTLPAGGPSGPEQASAFYEHLHESLAAVPGVEAVGLTSELPLSGQLNDTFFTIEGRPPLPVGSNALDANIRVVGGDYFRAMGIPLLRGRSFMGQDRRDRPGAVVLNEPFVRQFFPDEDPLGRVLVIDLGQPFRAEIVGVVGGVAHHGLQFDRPPEMYLSYSQAPRGWANVIVQTSGDPSALTSAVRAAVWSLDRNQPLGEFATMEQILNRSVAQPRFGTVLLSVFGALALLLASVGIYGVMSYSVTQRTHEIGVRRALGAVNRDIWGMIIRRGLTLAGIGLAVGLAGALAVTRLLRNQLFNISATDPLTFVAVPVLLTLVALAACYVPARRAARVDPIVALRYE